MRDGFHADGDTWRITSDDYDARRAVRTVVFHCTSDIGRPYRVIELADPRFREQPVEDIPEQELHALFDRSHTMDYSHDPAANPESHGYGDPPLA